MSIVEEKYDPKAFGNAYIDLKCPNFTLRIVRDRGDLSCQIAQADKNDWHNLRHVFLFLKTKPISEKIEDLASAIYSNFNAITGLMKSDLKKAGFETFEKDHADEFLRKIKL